MAARRRGQERSQERDDNRSTPSQQDEADIVAESGAEPDENGELMVDEAKIRELGAVDATSVLENRRLSKVVDKKRANMPGITFNTSDPIVLYENTIKVWPANTIDISVRRLTGTPVQHVIISRPRSGAELYEAIKAVHGQYSEAEYEVKLLDTSHKVYRGTGRITMPDTRATQQPQQQQPQQGQPMNPPYYPPQAPSGYPPQYAPQYPPQYAQPQQAQPQQPQQAPQVAPQQAPQQPPTVQVMPSSFDPHSMMSMMDQMFGMFRQMQSAAQPPPAPPPVFLQPPPPPPPALIQQMPPMPSPQASPAEMMAWMQEAFRMFQQMQPPAPQPYMQPPAPQPAPQQPVQPPPSPQSGLVESMAMMEKMFGMFQRMQAPSSGPGPGLGGPGGPYRGPRPSYNPQGDQGDPRAPYYPRGDDRPPQYPAPPQRERTAAEQFREAMTVVRTAVDAVQEMNALMPQHEAPAATLPHEVDDDSPVQIIDTGPVKIAVNKSDGAMRWADTSMIALPGVLRWLGEQREAIQKESAARQTRQQSPPPQQLPPGFVEVGPGYQPPPGYVAVAVDTQGHPLPPPPAYVPPPIQSTPEPPVRRAWGAPTIPSEGEGQ